MVEETEAWLGLGGPASSPDSVKIWRRGQGGKSCDLSISALKWQIGLAGGCEYCKCEGASF